MGPGRFIDTDRYFVICANILGGCRGTTGPNSIDPLTGHPYAADFPTVTIADTVEVQRRLVRPPRRGQAAGGDRRLDGRSSGDHLGNPLPPAGARMRGGGDLAPANQPGAGVRRAIAGDDQGLTLPGRPEVSALFAEPDPQKLLASFAGISVAINTRSTEVYRILVSASGSDPEAAALLTSYTRMRDQGQKLIAAALARAHALQPRMRERDAADIIHALMSPELYRLLVIDRDWPPERYEKWLTSTLIDRLLAPR